MPSGSGEMFRQFKALGKDGQTSALDLLKGRFRKAVLVTGNPGTGKTHTIFEILEYLAEKKGLTPENTLVYYIDLDMGFHPIAEQVMDESVAASEKGLDISKRGAAFLSRIQYRPVSTPEDLMEATEEAIAGLAKFAAERGLDMHHREGLWLCLDDLARVWAMDIEAFSLDAYGMPLSELYTQKQTEAKAQNKATLPTLNQRDDYKVINAKHDEWMLKVKFSPYNFLMMTPLHFGELKADDREEANEKYIVRYGKKDVAQHFDYILAKFRNRNTNEWMVSVIKARGRSYYPPAMTIPRMTVTTDNRKFAKSPIPELIWGREERTAEPAPTTASVPVVGEPPVTASDDVIA